MDRDARVARVEAQGLEGIWLFPTAGVLYEQALCQDIEALCTLTQGFNRWLDEDWGLTYKGRSSSPLRTSRWPTSSGPATSSSGPSSATRGCWSCGPPPSARMTAGTRPAMNASIPSGRASTKPASPSWLTSEATATRPTATAGTRRSRVLGGGRKPTVAGLISERAIYDFLLTFAYDKMFERFPNLRLASIENGSGFLGDLFVKLEQSKKRMPRYYKEDPAELFRRNVWINPFWEDSIPEVIEHMGAGQVIYGSDWPHMEGMEDPRDIFEELDGVSLADQEKILRTNTAALNERRHA